jgi:predicted ArsR family transcriptional regulator
MESPAERDRMIDAVSSMGDPTRRRIFDLAVERGTVARDEVAEALGLPLSTAAFHLERLASAGLLGVSAVRRTGRTGPGAGRPAKVYSPAEQEIAVAVPQRRYDLMAQVLADAIESIEVGEEPRQALERVARDAGRVAGAAASSFASLLVDTGYRPTTETGVTMLRNCPFHQLVDRHRDLVCSANLAFLCGAGEAFGEDPEKVRLEPDADRCCVVVAS